MYCILVALQNQFEFEFQLNSYQIMLGRITHVYNWYYSLNEELLMFIIGTIL